MTQPSSTDDAMGLLDEAAALYLARQDDPDDPALAQRIEVWVARSPAHRRVFQEIAEGWQTFSVASDESIADLRAKAFRSRRHWARWLPAAMAAAACLALAVGAGDAIRHYGASQAEVATTEHFSTRKGEHKILALTDGSHVTLDADSRLDVTLETHVRRLVLSSGRAYFQVAHDATRPFIVKASGREIVAVGTEFDVSNDQGRVQVLLAQGKVVVRDAGPRSRQQHAVALTAGQLVRFDSASERGDVGHGDIPALTAWREGRLRFDAEPLSDALLEINRHRDVPLHIADPSLDDVHISGVFQVDQTDAFVFALTNIFPITSETHSTSIELRRKASGK